MANNLDSLLTEDPNIRNGRPRIAGSGITVHRIAIWYRLGHSAEEIARQYPHLSLEGVYAALAFYHANRDAIDADIEADELAEQQLEAEYIAQRRIAS